MKAVVVFPFVPVTAAISSSSAGRPKNTGAASAIASLESATTTCGTRDATGCSTTSAAAPASIARPASSCPSNLPPRTQKKSAPGSTARVS